VRHRLLVAWEILKTTAIWAVFVLAVLAIVVLQAALDGWSWLTRRPLLWLSALVIGVWTAISYWQVG
jgi:hypothetical protein